MKCGRSRQETGDTFLFPNCSLAVPTALAFGMTDHCYLETDLSSFTPTAPTNFKLNKFQYHFSSGQGQKLRNFFLVNWCFAFGWKV
ncbi:hypothetical protein CEXT_441191 [Caerostris extrusa]|uniref:Uncharacterized protein n=1 Tax=Caerostris extrusa TaxID=172846 RepID=A0AAV4UBP0_CAEEX|nr:hypothetical protein CEXT_441191 [Caerostris extrusa]